MTDAAARELLRRLPGELKKLSDSDTSFDAHSFATGLRLAVERKAFSVEEAADTVTDMLTCAAPGVPEVGRELLREFAGTGDLWATLHYAQSLLRGDGGAADPVEAFSLLSAIVAQTGLPDDATAYASRLLGECYYTGAGVGQDVVRAIQLYERAAELGDATAAFRAGVAWQGDVSSAPRLPTAPDYDRAAKYYAMGGEDTHSLTNLGLLHLRWRCSDASPTDGVALLRTAAERGDEIALRTLDYYRRLGATCAEALAAVSPSSGPAKGRTRSRTVSSKTPGPKTRG